MPKQQSQPVTYFPVNARPYPYLVKAVCSASRGHRLHGRTCGTGEEHGASISIDGSTAILFGGWDKRSGAARIDDDRVCFAFPAMFVPALEQAAHQAAICRNSAASTVRSATVFISEIT